MMKPLSGSWHTSCEMDEIFHASVMNNCYCGFLNALSGLQNVNLFQWFTLLHMSMICHQLQHLTNSRKTFNRKLCCHWLKGLWQCDIISVTYRTCTCLWGFSPNVRWCLLKIGAAVWATDITQQWGQHDMALIGEPSHWANMWELTVLHGPSVAEHGKPRVVMMPTLLTHVVISTESGHDANLIFPGRTGVLVWWYHQWQQSWHHDNLVCHQWWQSWHHDDSTQVFSVWVLWRSLIHYYCWQYFGYNSPWLH